MRAMSQAMSSSPKVRPRGRTRAAQADPQDLYQRSVQRPAADVALFDRLYRDAYGRRPLRLREDFCGGGLVACEWVRSRRDRTAVGVDLDARVLAWGEARNVAALPEPARSRVRLLRGDVRALATPPADVVAAGNFSFFTFKTRPDLRAYFEAARRHLADEGVLVLDVLGGAESYLEDREEVRRMRGGFTYVWDQQRYDPVTGHARFAIHFRFPDGSERRDAFTYDWRMWSIPEIGELLLEAGFRRFEVYWEGTERDTRKGNGVFRRVAHAPADPCWLALVAGIR